MFKTKKELTDYIAKLIQQEQTLARDGINEHAMPPLSVAEITAIVAATTARWQQQGKACLPIFVLQENTYSDPQEFSAFLQTLSNNWDSVPENARWQIVLSLDKREGGDHWTYLDLKKVDNALSVIIIDAARFNSSVEQRVRGSLKNSFSKNFSINSNIFNEQTHFHGPYCGTFTIDTAFRVRKTDIHQKTPESSAILACKQRLFRVSQEKQPEAIPKKALSFRQKTLRFLNEKTLIFLDSISEADYQKILKNRTGIEYLEKIPTNAFQCMVM